MTQGRHRKPTDTTMTMKKIALGATVGLGAVAVPATFAGTASAVPSSDWDRIAQCESSGDWSINHSEDGMSVGGLQFQNASWQDALQYLNSKGYDTSSWPQILSQGMPTSEVPTKAQQITAAEALLALQPDPWTASRSCSGVSLSQSDSVFNGGQKPAEFLEPGDGSTPPPATTPASTGTLDPITGATVPKPKEGSPADLAVKYAIAAIGYNLPYVYGGNGPQDGGWDCSGLTSQAWKAGGVDFTESARDSYSQEVPSNVGPQATLVTSTANLLPGDLVTYDGFEGGHVALYVGPIGPNGEDLIETNSRHPERPNVNWSFMDERSGRGPSARTAMVRPAPFVPADGSATGGNTGDTNPPPSDGGTTTPPPSDGGSTTPPPSTGGGDGTTTPPPVSSTDGTYTVVVGDYLDKIAREHNVPGGWPALYAANRDVVGDNPDLIFPGQVLRLPTGSVAHHSHHHRHHHWGHHHWK